MNPLPSPIPPDALPALPPLEGCPPPLPPGLDTAASPHLLWGVDGLRAAARPNPSWLWQGYLAPGAVTLLTSQWKSGKTTLASVLLSRLKTGGQLAGLALAPGRAVVVTEESPDDWQRRAGKLDFSDHVGWFCRPFRGKPTFPQWLDLLDRIAALHARHPLQLVLIDPLAAFLSGDENHAASVLKALSSLQRLTCLGLCLWLLHHPRRGRPKLGQAARGSGALLGFADILIEMRRAPHAVHDDRRRRLFALSRYEDTPRQLVLELSADGTDYLSRGSFQEDEFAGSWGVLQALLKKAPRKLTRPEILQDWPAGKPLNDSTLYRLLERAVAQKLVCRDGRGVRKDPFRYWLTGQEEAWYKDPLAFMNIPGLVPPDAPHPGGP